jgi:iron-sulfur cluster assembly protein
VITVTEEAKELFQNVERPEGAVLRLDLVKENEVGIVFGEPQSDDQVVEHEGEELLHISGLVSQALDGSTLDRVETPEGTGITIRPPEPGTDSSQ